MDNKNLKKIKKVLVIATLKMLLLFITAFIINTENEFLIESVEEKWILPISIFIFSLPISLMAYVAYKAQEKISKLTK